MATEETTEDGLSFQLLGTLCGLCSGPAVGYVAYLLFEAPAFGLVVGAMVGFGSYLYVPYVLRFDDEATDPTGEDPSQFHTGAIGIAIQAGGGTAFALGFVVGASLEALLAGLVVAVLAGVLLSWTLPAEPDR